MLYRFIQNRLETLFKYFPCVLLTGARQVGKTTLIKELVAADSIVTFDPIEDIRGAKADPDLFLKQMKSPGFLDEVQYVPQVLASLKRFVDERANDKSLFYLSGSQNLSVLRGAAESMAGRIAVLDLYPLCFKEIFQRKEHGVLEALLQNNEDDFSKFGDGSVPPLSRLMWRGGMPGLLDMPDQLISDFFTGYMRTYIERDVRSIAEISNLNLFSRFVRLISALSAQEINSNELGRDLGIDRTTAVRWENICEASYQWIK
ncbi:MAG: AAA family ATPase, partial [Fibrobacteraceae bacterium]|nr:AAA family ATPase [Fibrobacteraceae bacterium]